MTWVNQFLRAVFLAIKLKSFLRLYEFLGDDKSKEILT